MRPPSASLTTGIEREYLLRQEFCALFDICSYNAQRKSANESATHYWQGRSKQDRQKRKRSKRDETRPSCLEARFGGIAFSRVVLSGLASSAFPRCRQCRAFPMPLDISRYETELEVPATNNSTASGVRRQMIDIRQERVETVAPAWIDMEVGRKHASVLFPQELVLMSFWHDARVGMLGYGSNSERAV